jgi:hypothetical protein
LASFVWLGIMPFYGVIDAQQRKKKKKIKEKSNSKRVKKGKKWGL